MDPTKCLGSPVNRRTMLHVGFLGGLGLTLDSYLRMQSASAADTTPQPAAKKGPKAEAVIHIFLPGGMAHQESWDPKPYAPVEYRGEMTPIATKLDGVFLNECLKNTAQIADKLTIVRSFTHGEAAHERGTHNMFTGYRPSPALTFPSMGSVVSHELGVRNNLPPYVAVPNVVSNLEVASTLYAGRREGVGYSDVATGTTRGRGASPRIARANSYQLARPPHER